MSDSFAEHAHLTRRFFLQFGTLGTAALGVLPFASHAAELEPELADAVARLESFFTSPSAFRDVSRGKPIPHTLSEEKKAEVGLTRETWKLEVTADPENPARLRKPLTKEKNTALDFTGLMQLAEKHVVRFAKTMTCLNIGCPLGTGIWEGVPLREVIWLTEPVENLRRVFYHGFHNDDPKQLFRSSLPVGRILEEMLGLPPVILCYKLNGEWLDGQRGGPVRVVVPEAYGFKSVKWLTHVTLTNFAHSNDTYADGNNDIDSPLKTFAATLSVPKQVAAGQPIPLTGYAQVGISGLSKVQVWLHPNDQPWDESDKNFVKAPWRDATILPPPKTWGGHATEDIANSQLHHSLGFDTQTGQPKSWPMRLAKVHWATLLPGVPAGDYTLRCRTVDEQGIAQPMPRPFRKSGHSAIEEVKLTVAP